MQKVYHEFYRIYGEENGFDPENVKEIITEDSNSGYQFFRAVCRRDISCRSAAENSNALGAVEKSNRSEILVIADGAAFGQYMGQLDTYQRRHHNVHLFLPESFEWLILKSDLVDGKEVKEILTVCLQYMTKGTFLQYQKSALNSVYLQL